MKKQTPYQPKRINHPGLVLAEKLQELNIGSKEFAVRTGKPEKTISAILNEKSSITADMAILFELTLGIPSNYWLKHQIAYDIDIAEQKRARLHADQIKWTTHFPIKELVNLGYLSNKNSKIEQLLELLSFFGFSDVKAWENYYLKQKLKVNFSISLLDYPNPYLIATWLRMGDIQASDCLMNTYVAGQFKNTLQSIAAQKSIISFEQLQQLCARTGVNLVNTLPLKDLNVKGATRWINNLPLIQIAVDFHSPDFWPTFFHEAAHILLHGKKEIFLEHLNNSLKNCDKEQEADDLAKKYL